MRKWSPGSLYRELRSSPTETLYQYPSRKEAGVLLLILSLELGFSAFISTMFDEPFLPIVSGFVALPLGVVLTRRIWDQRALRIRPAGRRISYLRRTPFRDTQETLRFADLTGLRIDQSARAGADDSEPSWDLHLHTVSGDRIFLGAASRVEVVNSARRLSGLLDIPLRMPPIPR